MSEDASCHRNSCLTNLSRDHVLGMLSTSPKHLSATAR